MREVPQLTRIVVAIDPAVTSGEDADETGIIVAGIDARGHAYVLGDDSGQYQPHEWAKRAIKLYKTHGADRIIAEINQGGEMVEATIRAIDSSVPYKGVHASRGKVARAEPVSALYEQRRVHHLGAFPQLEDQMTAFTSDFDRQRAGYSPDRVDALVWALTELLIGANAGWGIFEFYRLEAGAVTAKRAIAESTERDVVMIGPGTVSHVYTRSGEKIAVDADGSVTVTAEDAAPLRLAGWRETSLQEN